MGSKGERIINFGLVGGGFPPFAEFPTFPFMLHPGRNDPCPCGSGKKYKKCCLQKDIETQDRRTLDFTYESHLAMRRAVTEKLDRILSLNTTKKEIQAYVDFYWDTPLLDDEELDRLRDDKETLEPLTHQLMASLQNAFVLKRQTPARFALMHQPNLFSAAEREYLQTFDDARLTYIQTREFSPESGSFVAEDLFDGSRFTIFDKNISIAGRPHDLACGRLVPFPGRDGFVFEPLAGSIIPPQEKDKLLDALASLHEDELLEQTGWDSMHGFLKANPIVFYWIDLWIWYEMSFPPMPNLVTSDGEELVLIQARFSASDPGSLLEALGRQRNFQHDEEKGRHIFTWLNQKDSILGTLWIKKGSDELRLETNSRERFKKWEKKLKSLGNVTFLDKQEESSASMLLKASKTRQGGKAGTGKQNQAPLQGGLTDAQLKEIFPQLKEQIITRWLSETVPALGGITPIEASKTPQGRKRLDELFEEFENRNARVPTGQQGMVVMDVDKLRKRLGMEE